MPVLPLILAAALAREPLALYRVPDARGAIEDSWRQVASEQDGRCAIAVTGNGQFFRITMSGFAPGEVGYFRLTNGEYFRRTDQKIRPIEYRFESDEEGQFSKIYLPFLWYHSEGTVSVTARGEDCDVSLSFPWSRARVRVHTGHSSLD